MLLAVTKNNSKMYATIQALKKCGLIEVDWLRAHKEEKQKNEHLLAKIHGFITVYTLRPPITTLLKEQHLPRPKELAIVQRPGQSKSLVINDGFVKVTPNIYRSPIDDCYIFDTNDEYTHYLIVEGKTPCSILQSEILKIINQFALCPDFPNIIWSEIGLKRTPRYVQRLKSSCKFFGDDWSVTITFCPDTVLRITAWDGIITPIDWDTGQAYIFTDSFPTLVITPKRFETSFTCDIDILEPFS